MCHQDSSNNRPRDQNTVSESSRRFRTEFLEDWPQTPGSPYFDPSTPDNVTGLVGHPVTLLCKVKNLQNRTVSKILHLRVKCVSVWMISIASVAICYLPFNETLLSKTNLFRVHN